MFPANVCSCVFTIAFQGSLIKVCLITIVQNSVREYKCEGAAEIGRNREREKKKLRGGGRRMKSIDERKGRKK